MVGYLWFLGCVLCLDLNFCWVLYGYLVWWCGGAPGVLVLCRVLVGFVASGFWFVGLVRVLVV